MKSYIFSAIMGMIGIGIVYASTPLDDQRLATETLVYINQYRVQHGLPKLVMNSVLSQEAAKHSQAMASHALPFGHDGFPKRIHHLHGVIPNSTSGAENVAYNYKTAKIVAEGWIHSAGHRHNIVGHYNLTGIGIARDKMGRPYFTQLFLRTDQQHAHRIAASNRSHPLSWLRGYRYSYHA